MTDEALEIWSHGGCEPIPFYNHKNLDSYPKHLCPTYFLNINVGFARDVAFFVTAARQYIHQAANDIIQAVARGYSTRNSRSKPLIVLPLIGTGYGGARSRMGQLIQFLIPTLIRCAEEYHIDVCLCTNEHSVYSALSRFRIESPLNIRLWKKLMTKSQRAKARELALRAADQSLVFFFGAGASANAGLPLWNDLLKQLAARFGFNEDEIQNLGSLDPLDQASIIAKRAGGEIVLQQVIAEILDVPYFGLIHPLMSSLPINEFITKL